MFRKANLFDIGKIIEIKNLAVKKMLEVDKFKQWDENYPSIDVLVQDINSENLYVLEVENVVTGFICINIDAYDAYNEVNWNFDENFMTIHRVCVDPRIQNMGLGKILLNNAENIIKDLGYNYIKIDTNSQNMSMNKLLVTSNYNYVGQMNLKPNLPLWNCYDKKI